MPQGKFLKLGTVRLQILHDVVDNCLVYKFNFSNFNEPHDEPS